MTSPFTTRKQWLLVRAFQIAFPIAVLVGYMLYMTFLFEPKVLDTSMYVKPETECSFRVGVCDR